MIEIPFTVEDKVCVIMRGNTIYGVKDGHYGFYRTNDFSDNDVSFVLMMQKDAERKCEELGDGCSYCYIAGTATIKGWAPYNDCNEVARDSFPALEYDEAVKLEDIAGEESRAND